MPFCALKNNLFLTAWANLFMQVAAKPRSAWAAVSWHADCIKGRMQEVAVLASSVLANQREFTTIADNVANVNTDGFRKLSMSFQEIASNRQGKHTASYVEDRALYINPVQGSMQNTGNPLDVAIMGQGYFAIQDGANVVYTRNGRFVVDSNGALSTPTGQTVLDNAGAAIQFPEDVRNISIEADGTISTEQGQIAQLGVYQFTAADEKRMQRVGSVGFLAPASAQVLAMDDPTIKQGFIEGSNVNAVEEMVTMQRVSKAYENSLAMLRKVEDLEQRAIRNLGVAQ